MRQTLADQIALFVCNAASRSSFSRMEPLGGIDVADAPIVGFANGYDGMVERLKSVVSPNHRTPLEAWREEFPSERAPANLTVISFVLPFSEAVRKSNRREKEPSVEWLSAKVYSEAILNDIQTGLISFLTAKGHLATAPSRVSTFRIEYGLPSGPAANWSERHYGYAAGIGTFGLSRGLITKRGVAMRCASILTDAKLSPTPRPISHTAYCQFLESGDCGDCINRCPAGAISVNGKDNNVCRAYLNTLEPLARKAIPSDILKYVSDRKLTSITACGLCQTAVPCEHSIPPKSLFATPQHRTL
jgi:epoxyqueuosine reductase QueG